MRLYHMLPATFALQNIEKRRLKIARFADLNDPFELAAVELSVKAHRAPIRNFKARMHDRFGLLCFTTEWKSPVMWSHYADKHRGMCLGFDVAGEVAQPVSYDAKRISLEFIEGVDRPRVEPSMVEKLLTIKYEEWSYEKEVRVFLPLEPTDLDGDHYFQRFDGNIALREIIVGPLCESPIDLLRSHAKSFSPDVSVVKARLAFQTFTVVPDRRFLQE